MMENRTRTFEAMYTHKDGKQDKLKVRINPRLVSLFLALTLTASTTACSFSSKKTDKTSQEKNIESSYEYDLEAIKKIIEEHPEMLSIKESTTHVVKVGETISDIAEMYGTTVDEVKHLNKEKLNGKTTIYPDEELRVKFDVKLSEEDRNINILEAYIYDYVFRESQLAKIIEDNNEKQGSQLYRSLLYGYPQDANTIDPNSINGQAIRAYTAFHDEEIKQTEESKTKYINILKNIVLEISEKTKDMVSLVSYDEFEVYCLNRSTEYKEVIEKTYTPYGDMIKNNGK